jgi:hypothetical protein
MKTIKNLMVAALVMFAGNAMAQTLSAEAISITPGDEDGTDLVIKYESEQDLTAAQFTIALPDGVTIKKNGKKYAAAVGEDIEEDYEWKIKDGDAGKIVLITRVDNTCPALTSGIDLITLTLVADETAATGNAKISGITFSDKGTSVKGNEDFEVAITVVTTGINSIDADGSNEPAFNLAGQKVGKNYKGIVVKNGKKVAVK